MIFFFKQDPFLVIHSFSSILKRIPIAFGGSGEWQTLVETVEFKANYTKHNILRAHRVTPSVNRSYMAELYYHQTTPQYF